MSNATTSSPKKTPHLTGVKETKLITREKAEAVQLVGEFNKIGKVVGRSLHAIYNKFGDLVASHRNEARNDQDISILKLIGERKRGT